MRCARPIPPVRWLWLVLVSDNDITSPPAVGRSGDTLLLFVLVPVLVSDKDIISPTAVGRSGDTLLLFVLVLFRTTCMFANSEYQR